MRILEAGAAPFVVGGDHSVALPALRAVAARHGALAVIHLDAHLDTSGPHTWGHEHHHGTPLRHAITERLVAPGQLYQVGIRAPWGSAEDGDLGASHGALRYPVCALHALGIDAVAREITTRIGSRPTYLTVDVDVVDPAFAPGTGTPVPGGLSSHELLAFLGQLAGLNLVGMDLVEVCPPLDHADITSHLAASTLFTGLALLAAARHRGGR
jgi:agmatinase